MKDQFIRGDLLRLGVLLVVIAGILAGLKIYDRSTNSIERFGSRIFNGIIAD